MRRRQWRRSDMTPEEIVAPIRIPCKVPAGP